MERTEERASFKHERKPVMAASGERTTRPKIIIKNINYATPKTQVLADENKKEKNA
ncbi:MAG: hypothetical protein IJR26_02410 [Bacteroidales bacterium]|nr:hypothetical protein [Bacteroidales bacterium]